MPLPVFFKYAEMVSFLSFSGLADFKHRFRGEEVGVYVASRHEFNARPLLGLLSVCGTTCPPRELATIFLKASRAFLFGQSATKEH